MVSQTHAAYPKQPDGDAAPRADRDAAAIVSAVRHTGLAGSPQPGTAGAGAGPAADTDPNPGLRPGRSRQNSAHRRTMAVCDKVGAAVVRGADAAELTAVFAQASGKPAILLDPGFRPQAQAGGSLLADMDVWDPGDITTARLLRMVADERRTLRVPPVPGSGLARGCLAAPVMLGDTILGYLLVVDEPAAATDDVDLIVASYAATLFALTLARAQTGQEVGRRYRGAVVDSLVSGHFLDGLDARRKARILGVADSRPYRIAVARVSAAKTQSRHGDAESADDLLGRLASYVQFPAVVRGPELVMLLPDQAQSRMPGRDHVAGSRPADPVQVLREQRMSDVQLTCGVSELTGLPDRAPEALQQAQHAIDLGLRLGWAGQTISYEELGIYRLLFQIGDMNQLHQYAEDVLGPLIDYDAGHKSDLLGTLSVYLNQRESLKQTARVLRVHVNTVSYRIQRIESMTSLDLTNSDDRLSAHVATKIMESQRAAGRK